MSHVYAIIRAYCYFTIFPVKKLINFNRKLVRMHKQYAPKYECTKYESLRMRKHVRIKAPDVRNDSWEVHRIIWSRKGNIDDAKTSIFCYIYRSNGLQSKIERCASLETCIIFYTLRMDGCATYVCARFSVEVATPRFASILMLKTSSVINGTRFFFMG